MRWLPGLLRSRRARVHDGRRPSLLGDLNETFLGYIKDDRIICPGQNRRCMDRNNHEST